MLILLLNSCPTTIAGEIEAAGRDIPNELDEINTVILKGEMEILSINTDLIDNQEKLSKAKRIRIALYNFVAATFIDATVITVASTKWATYSNPHKASQALVRCGPIGSMIGNSILMAGIFFESAFPLTRKTNQTSAGTKINQLRDLYRRLAMLFAERDRLTHNQIATSPLEQELS